MLSDIVITSNLGPFPERRAARLQYHIEQRKVLKKWFPEKEKSPTTGDLFGEGFYVHSLCSGYNEQEDKKLRQKFWNVNSLLESTPKWKKHNMILKKLYQSKKLKSLLFLDDDTIPVDLPEFPNAHQEICNWLRKPETMPAPCIFFSIYGILVDVYYRNREPGLFPAPLPVLGAAILVRSDLGVLMNQENDGPAYYVDDMAFRVHCAVAEKHVLKHNSIFFKTLQGTKTSTLVQKHEDRVQHIRNFEKYLISKFPHVMLRKSNGRPFPIWMSRGKRLEVLVKNGLVNPNPKLGNLPITAALAKRWKPCKLIESECCNAEDLQIRMCLFRRYEKGFDQFLCDNCLRQVYKVLQ